MSILYKSFHVIDIENEMSTKQDISEDFNSFVENLVEFSNQNEKTKLYTVSSLDAQVVRCIKQAVTHLNDQDWNENTLSISKHLIECEKMAQAKIYQMNSHVKKGSLVQALIQKEEDEFQYIIAKVEHMEFYDGMNLTKNYGFSSETKNIWKFAVFSLYTINDNVFFNDVKIYTDTKAKYWTVSFLELEEKRDDESNTYKAYRAIDNELKSAIKTTSPRDYVVLSNEVQNTLQKSQPFNYSSYVEDLMDQYQPTNEDIDKEVVKDCLLALPTRKNFDPEFTIAPQSIENKRTKKYQISEGIELMIKSTSHDFSKRITSTMKDGKKILEIVCDDYDTYDAFIDE